MTDGDTQLPVRQPRPAIQAAGVPQHDQTESQPVVWRCPNPECRESPLDRYFDFIADEPRCPKCGQEPPAVAKRVLIHFLQKDADGPIVGANRMRFSLLCDPPRTYIATATNGEAASGDLGAVNCPGCLKIAGDKLLKSGTQITRTYFGA